MSQTSEPRVYAIIVAAGSGTRFGSQLPKQFCILNGKPLLMTTISRMKAALPADSVIIPVINTEHESLWHELCDIYGFESPSYTFGGSSRWESVKNAIDYINPEAGDIIMVHDGARPFVTSEIISNLIKALEVHQGAIPAVPVSDSIRLLDENGITSTPIDRSKLRAVQTPQAFRAELLKDAFKLPFRSEFTDDASVMSAAGYNDIALVEGDSRNIKVTMPQDIKIATLYLSE